MKVIKTAYSKKAKVTLYISNCFYILLFIWVTNPSGLQAQEPGHALIGSSFVLPLEQKNWPLKAGTEAQLFVDGYVVHSMNEVVRIYHQPRKYEGNPILKGMANGTIIYVPEEKQYRMYYDAGHRVAFSKDGIKWELPKLGLISFEGTTANNIIIGYDYPSDLASFIYDPGDPDPDKRWKAAKYYYDKQENPRWSKAGGQYGDKAGLYGFYSPDGLHWDEDSAVLLIPGRQGKLSGSEWPLSGADDVSVVTWDGRLGKYVAWLKIWDPSSGRYKRARAMALSDDFTHWSQPWVSLLPDKMDPPGLQFYGMVGWPYESMWVGLLRAFHSGTSNKPVDLQLVTSHDGIHWSRANNRGAFIPNGPEGSYDHGYHHDFSNPPLRFGDELYFYYASTPYGKRFPIDYEKDPEICLAKLRVDGFASLRASGKPGPSYVITRPLDFTGTELYLNANAKGGSIRVEILKGGQDDGFEPIPGFTKTECIPLENDGVALPVYWKKNNSLASLKGERVRLKVYLEGAAALYSFAIY